jgi:transcriptional regulator with XRE-family HTH domain
MSIHLAGNLKYLRQSAGLTQREVGHRLGIKSNALYPFYEAGTSRPRLSGIINLAEFFQVPVGELCFVDMQDAKELADYRAKVTERPEALYMIDYIIKCKNSLIQTSIY